MAFLEEVDEKKNNTIELTSEKRVTHISMSIYPGG